MRAHGFGDHFTVLFDEESPEQPHLPAAIREIYQGDWQPLSHPDRPYTFINFVTSRDGRISFAEPGHLSGADVSCFNQPDLWLMGMLRARCDAIMMGDGTLRSEPSHLWTCDFIFPAEREAFLAMRAHFGLAPLPLHVFLSLEGELVADAAVFQHPEMEVIIATTSRGKQEAERRLAGCPARISILDLGSDTVDLPRLMQLLYQQYQIHVLLCEGGPRVYGSMLKAGVLDDEFLTLSPIMLGEEPGKPRPSLVEGSGFAPGTAPTCTILSLRRVGSHLFMRSRWRYSS
jgi:5-amino-6-(5-phosphoribosylamino)uracil reductase